MKFIENKKIEYYILATFILSIGLTFINVSFRLIPLVICFSLLTLLYLIRLIISFRHWRFSRGISVINAYLNFELMYIVLAISYTFLNWPGSAILTYNAVTGPQFFLLIIGIFLIIRWTKLNKVIYWNILKENTYKVIIGIAVCFILFYYFDMPSKFNKYPPVDQGFSLPRHLFNL
jgi:hypothetical protein